MPALNDDIVFIDETPPSPLAQEKWRVLVVDDDRDIHTTTEIAMDSTILAGRRLEFLHAYSASEAREILARESDIAAILLDVVMESEDAGLKLVQHIREQLQLNDVRIILRTGQPGTAPEMDVIRNYDINDYRTKSELTRTKLCTTLTSAIRSYEQLHASNQARIQLAAAKEEGEMRFRFIAATTLEAMIVTDEDHCIVFWNEGAEKIFGLNSEAALGKHITFMIPEPYRDHRNRSFAKIIDQPSETQQIGAISTPNLQLIISPNPEQDNQLPVELLISSWNTGKGKHYSSIFRDISERCRYEDELIAARDAANASTRAKADFLANMSHEIRTPMHGILGMTDLALATPLSPEQREYIQLAHTSAENLLSLINDILDFSKIEAGKLTLEHIDFDLRAQLQEVVKPLSLRAQQQGLDLVLDIDSALPERFIGDPLRVRQLILNLVSNALKFTETGRISILVKTLAPSDRGFNIQCAVSDTGIGIPADKLHSIFDAFTQADTSTSRQYGGTGLGLSICAQLVRLMQGKIWVESTLGQGSTFYFTVCLETQSAPTENPSAPIAASPSTSIAAESIGFRPLRILLAEDNPVNQTFAMAVLSKAGHQVTLAQNGQQAVGLAKQQAFDVILMDMHMPVMDGLQAAQAIRVMNKQTPIIALSAQTEGDFRTQCLDAGMNDTLPKPIRAETLLMKLSALSISDTAPPSPQLPDAPTETTLPPLDLAEALLTAGGDHELLIGMARLALQQIDENMPTLRSLSRTAKSDQLKERAHRLKGSLASMAANPAFEACKALESKARTAKISEYESTMDALELEIRRLRPALEAILRSQNRSNTSPT